MANKPLVLLEWDDAEDQEGTWLDEKDVAEFAEKSCLVRSTGYLVSRGPKYTTIAGDWIEKLGHYGRVTKVPSGMVVKLTYLEDTNGGS